METISKECVSTLKGHGFSGWDTGGGCMALRKNLADGTLLMITNLDAGLDGMQDGLCLGLEDKEGNPILELWVDNPKNIYFADNN